LVQGGQADRRHPASDRGPAQPLLGRRAVRARPADQRRPKGCVHIVVIVACVYRTGGIYTREWVSALRRALGRWMPTGYRFVCLTDDLSVEPYWRIPLVHNWPGWFSK